MKQNYIERRNTSRKIKSMRENTERDRQAWKATLYALGKSNSLSCVIKEQLLFIDAMTMNSLEKENTTGQKKNGITAFQRPLFPFHKEKYCNYQSIDNYSIYKKGTDGSLVTCKKCA
jgi:hypothetical protein